MINIKKHRKYQPEHIKIVKNHFIGNWLDLYLLVFLYDILVAKPDGKDIKELRDSPEKKGSLTKLKTAHKKR